MTAQTYPDSKPDSKLYYSLFVAAVLVKCGLATVSPSSFDFFNIARGALFVSNGTWFQGPYTFSTNFIYLFYRLWLLAPVNHQWPYQDYSFMPSPSGFLLIFILKLPLIAFDILTSVLIYQLVLLFTADRRLSIFATLVWLFNPYLTIAIEMDGTMDIISTFLVVSATYLFVRGRYVVSGICLALATAARFYPIALIPFYPLFLLKEGKYRKLSLMIGSYFISLFVILLPFLASYGKGFLNVLYELPVGGNKEFIWFFGFMPSVGSTTEVKISSVVTVLVIVVFLALRMWKNDRRLVLDMVLIALITYVGLSHWNRYYTIWVTPFLTMDLAANWNGKCRRVYAALFTLFFLSAFVYNTAYWWSASLFYIYEFTPQVSEMARFMLGVGDMLRTGDFGTTFSQSVLAGACIIYSAVVVLRNTIGTKVGLMYSPTRYRESGI